MPGADPDDSRPDAARFVLVKHLVPFHYDPGRDDAKLDAAVQPAVTEFQPEFPVTLAIEGAGFGVG